jgi:hypothetical protein
MARQEAACWSCGTRWADEDVPVTTLRVIAGGADTDRSHAALTPGGMDPDRWIIDGGSFDSEAAPTIRVSTARR